METNYYKIRFIAVKSNHETTEYSEEWANKVSTIGHTRIADTPEDAIRDCLSDLRYQKNPNDEFMFADYNFIPVEINGKPIILTDRNCNFRYV